MGVEVEYQRALYTAINAARVSLGVVGVYDVAPQVIDGGSAAPFPYVVMGRIFALALDTQTKNGFTMTTRIHTFSRTGAMAECKAIQGGIYDLLHRQPMTVTGFNEFELLRNDSDTIADQDGKIHGICEYIGLIEVST